MPKVILKHTNGSRTGRVEQFEFAGKLEVLVGREADCGIIYADADDLVSRKHALIYTEDSDSQHVKVVDLGSRNGTFVNHERIQGPVALHQGDLIQFGPNGPGLAIDLGVPAEPKMTRLASAASVALSSPAPAAPRLPAPVVSTPARGAVGRNTLERVVGEAKNQTRRYMLMVAGIVLLLGAGVTFLLVRNKIFQETESPAQIAAAYTDSVVEIEVRWELIYPDSGKKLYHLHVRNTEVKNAGPRLPVFVLVGENRLEPLLVTDDGGGLNEPIGFNGSGSGFVVTDDGFILTNRHVAAGWGVRYDFTTAPVGKAIVFGSDGKVAREVLIPAENFPRTWIPSEGIHYRSALAGPLEGRNYSLNVVFAKTKDRIASTLSRVSEKHDVALIKASVPRRLTAVKLQDTYDTMETGAQVVVMGYPGISPDVISVQQSQSPFSTASFNTIPSPTVTSGIVAKVIRDTQPGDNSGTQIKSTMGDVYQLTINSTGHGNSGGPMFSDNGRVTGIFFAGKSRAGDAAITFAIPIRYGMELLSSQKLIH